LPTAWFICSYKRRTNTVKPVRYCAMDDFTPQIYGDGGKWSETEVLGNRAIVKVNASLSTLQAITSDPNFKRIPKDRLDDSLSDLPNPIKAALSKELENMGYSIEEIRAKFGNDLGVYTLRDVLRFMTRRRLEPVYNKETDTIEFSDIVVTPRDIDDVDREV
jgi:hypothetical protein